MVKQIFPRGVDSAKVIQVIETKALKQDEVSGVVSITHQYWDMSGKLLAENDGLEGCRGIEPTTLPIKEWHETERHR